MTGEDLTALATALGVDALQEHAPVPLDGVALRHTLAPASGDALAAVLRALHERGLATVVRGGGSRLELGNPPQRADCLLSTEALAGIDVLDAEEGVVHARAGTPLERLRTEARAVGWELPLDPPGETSTVGGALAAAALGPRSLGFGRARDCVLGLEVALAGGARTRCGGRVVKNVTGYDLQKLYTGSLGTLGVIEAAWLRLRPRPERVETLRSEPSADVAGALATALAVARRPGARAVALLDPRLADDAGLGPARAPVLVAELAGGAALVESVRARLHAELTAHAAPDDAVARVRALQGAAPAPGGLRARVDALPDRLADAARPLAEAGARLLVYPGQGLIYAQLPNGLGGLAAVRAAARAGRGGFRLEAAPLEVKRECDVFGEDGGPLALMRAVKHRYDPRNVLNPGRFLGGA